MIKLSLPFPPSVNHYWGQFGKQRFIGKKGKEFRLAVAEACLEEEVQALEGPLSIHITLFPPDRRARDIDNVIKPLLDAMEHAGCFENDNQITELHIMRKDAQKGGSCVVLLLNIK